MCASSLAERSHHRRVKQAKAKVEFGIGLLPAGHGCVRVRLDSWKAGEDTIEVADRLEFKCPLLDGAVGSCSGWAMHKGQSLSVTSRTSLPRAAVLPAWSRPVVVSKDMPT
jgi:hypothetical protein